MHSANAIIGQSGGPTSVINSTLAGVMEAAESFNGIETLYGMNYGIEGFMDEKLFNLSAQSKKTVQGLRRTPSSALGSSRHKVKEEDFPRILEVLKRYNIRYCFLIGGNDTMDTIHRVEKYCREQNYELCGIGIPKTVDNDLFGTDHTPGFASAAWCNILNVLQGGWLAKDMKKVDSFLAYQTIGRDAGWLAAATALAKKKDCDAPHLIYCPERVFNPDEFLKDAKRTIDRYGWLSVVVSEGVCYADGTPVSASRIKDRFNNTEFGATGGASTAMTLHRILSNEMELRGEFQIPESLIMSAIDRALDADLAEAFECGRQAVKLARQEESGFMVSIKRVSNSPYSIEFDKEILENVAVRAKAMPDDFINDRGNFITEKFLEYMRPLTAEIPEYVELEPIFAKGEQ